MGGVRLSLVMDEVASVLEKITGLRVLAYPPPSINAPSGYVSYPRSIDYDEAYGRGEDRFTDLPIVLLAGKLTDRTARDTVTGWAAGSGPKSVKALAEAHAWTSCDDLTVTACEFDVETVAGNDYLAALFRATVVGPGEED